MAPSSPLVVKIGRDGEASTFLAEGGSPLRQLEYIGKKGLRVLACVRDKIPNFIQAAERLGKKIQVVLDEVPLHDWYAILNVPSAPVRSSISRFLPDNTSGGSDDDEETNSGASDQASSRVVLRGSDIYTITDIFLDGWLRGMGISADEVTKCLILDARLGSLWATSPEREP